MNCIKIRFIEVKDHTVIMFEKNAEIFGIKGHDVCNYSQETPRRNTVYVQKKKEHK